jgi:CRP-like cAMP-binding protein
MRIEDVAAAPPSRPIAALSVLAGQGSDIDRLRAFWRRVERFTAGAQVRLDGPRGGRRRVIVVSGWACEMRILQDGRRQIFGFMLPGDVIDERSTWSIGSRGVVALTRLEVVDADPGASSDASVRENMAEALCEAAIEREERLYDHLMRMGRLSARERVVHLLLELCERVERVGLLKGDTFRIPLTQEVFADALGLSVVHINRTMKQLRQEGSVVFKAGSVTLRERQKLAAMSHYRPLGPELAGARDRSATERRSNGGLADWAVLA